MRVVNALAALAVLAAPVVAAPGALAAEPKGVAAPAIADADAMSDPARAVRALYEGYYAALAVADAGAERPAAFDFEAVAERHFSAPLKARFIKAINGPDLVIDADFFINGQDYQDLKVISVETTKQDAATAVVTAVTSNFGQASTTELAMVKEADGWRIDDMTMLAGTPDAYRLTDILKDAGF